MNTPPVFKILLVILMFSSLFQCFTAGPATIWAGNKEHVEKRVDDLDQMNKNIVEGFPDKPQYGTIEYKAHVKEGTDGQHVEIIEKRIEIGPDMENEGK